MRVSEHNSTRGDGGRARRICFVVAALSLSVACAQDPRKETRQEAQALASWSATLRLVGDSWQDGSVPGRYAEKTIIELRESLREEGQTINASSTLPADARAALSDHARKLDALAGAMHESVTSSPYAMPQHIQTLAQEEQSLRDFAQQAGAQSK